MQRDWDVIRAVLVALEAKPEPFSSLWPKHIPEWDVQTVSYHMRLMSEAGLIEARCSGHGKDFSCVASALTWAGHELLDQIRSDSVWNAVKCTARERGVDLTFDTVKAVARKIVENLIL